MHLMKTDFTAFGVLVISVLSLGLTWFLFGRKEIKGWLGGFMYWFKSSLVSGLLVFMWMCIRWPGVSKWPLALLSLGLAGFITLCRSDAILLLFFW